jgi:RimJ/RimL family protein N-acetyltransferase
MRSGPDAAAPRVRLRDATLDDADRLDAWERQRSAFNDFGFDPEPIDREALKAGPLRNDHHGLLIVEVVADGRPIGTVSWHEVRYGPNPESAALNFGIELIADARGHGYGTDAQVLLAEYLFSETSINRLEAGTDVENIPEQRSLEKAGFRREGIARGCQYRAGTYHDLVVYARTRSDS